MVRKDMHSDLAVTQVTVNERNPVLNPVKAMFLSIHISLCRCLIYSTSLLGVALYYVHKVYIFLSGFWITLTLSGVVSIDIVLCFCL